MLDDYRWPGNIRQLENAVFRAVVLAETDTVGLEEFPQIAARSAMPGPARSRGASRPDPDTGRHPGRGFRARPHPARSSTNGHSAPPCRPHRAMRSPLLDAEGEVRPLDEIESELIRYAVTHYRGQMSEVARRLRIGRSTLYRKLEALGLNSERAELDS